MTKQEILEFLKKHPEVKAYDDSYDDFYIEIDGEILEKDITEDQVIDFCNDEFAETDNMETAIEEDKLYFDNIHDAVGMLEQFDYTVTEN